MNSCDLSERESLQRQLFQTRQTVLNASRQGDHRTVTRLRGEMARLSTAIAELEARIGTR